MVVIKYANYQKNDVNDHADEVQTRDEAGSAAREALLTSVPESPIII